MVTALKLEKDLNSITLEELVSSLRSHEIELEKDEPQKWGKFVALKSKPEMTRAYQVEEESNVYDEDSKDDDELYLISKIWGLPDFRITRFKSLIGAGF